ncbi:hypothetical protein SAMD00023353_5200590 [Rosellinia necatrix]|uniref:P-loop containing nucleoside triphosphate hydrolase n=1 Tax=Rosellinia necatrix TaxID=77044 RepID=A0A1W2TQJ2_ROSNE|nr:hypothetical protein SAMD00023353_5200590 [Rosellinia necatrix]
MSDGSNESQRQRDEIMKQQLLLLKPQSTDNPLGEIDTAPLFTKPVRDHSEQSAISTSRAPISQYGLLAGDVRYIQSESLEDAPIYYNVAAPSSIFICGSQGSGKSHTLSCILENCLIPLEKLGRLPHPLTGIVFHYDDYSSDSYVAPCEAAYLCSHPAVHVRVLCSPTNIRAIKKSYSKLGNVTVEALCLDQTNLNTKRMLELMAFDRAQPLYAQVIQRILREMRLKQQVNPGTFNYREFTDKLDNEQLSPDQKRGLRQRLDLLESFMVQNQVMPTWKQNENAQRGNNWTPKAGELIIVDLSCPCITTSMACALFNICLSIFLEQDLTQRPDSPRGRIVALDEAHRYMGDTSDCQVLTNSLLSAIRVQRHLGARIVISTQEPTISQKLLDLCSVTIVHRFSSPDWLNVLTKHLAGISKVTTLTRKTNDRDICDEETDHGGLHGIDISTENPIHDLFAQIVELSAGEALVFAPSAVMSLRKQKDPIQGFKVTPRKLAHHVLRVKVRARITEDGGRSVMAS